MIFNHVKKKQFEIWNIQMQFWIENLIWWSTWFESNEYQSSLFNFELPLIVSWILKHSIYQDIIVNICSKLNTRWIITTDWNFKHNHPLLIKYEADSIKFIKHHLEMAIWLEPMLLKWINAISSNRRSLSLPLVCYYQYSLSVDINTKFELFLLV